MMPSPKPVPQSPAHPLCPGTASRSKSLTRSTKPVMQADIARALRISQVAVSLALRDHPTISEGRRKQIKALAQQMGYRPNPAASTLAQFKRPDAVSTVQASLAWLNGWPDAKELRAYREFDAYWKGAQAAAEQLGYRLEEFRLNRESSPRQLQRILLARDIPGVLIPPHSHPRRDWLELDWSKFSVVRFGRSVPDLPAHSITADRSANGMLAFNAMTARGYRRIGFVSHHDTPSMAGAGFLWAQTQLPSGDRLPPVLRLENEPDDRCLTYLESWIQQYRPDAILTDVARLPAYLDQLGCRVPQDIGLATLTVRDCPINAGIDQQSEEIGRVAVHTLVSLIHTRETGFPAISRETLIPGAWVDGSDLPSRASTVKA